MLRTLASWKTIVTTVIPLSVIHNSKPTPAAELGDESHLSIADSTAVVGCTEDEHPLVQPPSVTAHGVTPTFFKLVRDTDIEVPHVPSAQNTADMGNCHGHGI